MKKFLSYLLLLCTILNISIEFSNLHAEKTNIDYASNSQIEVDSDETSEHLTQPDVEYVSDSQIRIDSRKLSENFTESEIDKLSFKNLKDEPLYSEDGIPKIEDVNQNRLSVCYFLSAVVSVLSVDPKKITDCLEDQNDGTVIVNLYGCYGHLHKIQVEKSIPDLSDEYSFVSNDSPLWIHMLLKGFVASGLYVSSRNYKDVEWGLDFIALSILTGNNATFYTGVEIGVIGKKKLLNKKSQAIENKKAVTAVFSPQTKFGQFEMLIHDTNREFVKDHAYSVICIDKDNYITIRNPWGKHDWAKDGIHRVPFDKFYNCCSQLSFSCSEPITKRGTVREISFVMYCCFLRTVCLCLDVLFWVTPPLVYKIFNCI